jgi:FkbM family methyltransferase
MTLASNHGFAIGLKHVSLPSGEYFVPKYAAHRPAARAILAGNFYEPDTHALVSRLLAVRHGSMIHAGTFFGDMLPSFSRACSGTVYAFEPVLENCVLAKLCVQANGLANVFLLNAGLGSHVEVAHIDTGEKSGSHRGGASQIADRGQFTALVTVDSFHIGNLAIIQLDVEGFELEALHGAVETIDRNSPVIMIEDNSANCPDFLASINYSLVAKIPGLAIWTSRRDESDYSGALKSIH